MPRGSPRFVPGHQEGFKKGQSGNPGGRPHLPQEVKDLARSYTVEAIERLAFWMKSDNPRASVTATNAILDRAWGKAPQPLTGDGEQPLVLEVTWKKPQSAEGGSSLPVVEGDK